MRTIFSGQQAWPLSGRACFRFGIGCIDLVAFYGRPLGQLYPFVMYGVSAMWVAFMVGLGFAGRSGHRWAFLAGILIYGADLVALVVTFSIWAFAVHAVFIFKWFQGQKALKDLNDAIKTPV